MYQGRIIIISYKEFCNRFFRFFQIKLHSHRLCLRQQEAGRGASRHANRGLCVSRAHRDRGYDNG